MCVLSGYICKVADTDFDFIQLLGSSTTDLLIVLIVHVRIQTGAECAKIAYSMKVQIDQATVAPNNVGCNKPVYSRVSR